VELEIAGVDRFWQCQFPRNITTQISVLLGAASRFSRHHRTLTFVNAAVQKTLASGLDLSETDKQ
jgi:hypothetical protein